MASGSEGWMKEAGDFLAASWTALANVRAWSKEKPLRTNLIGAVLSGALMTTAAGSPDPRLWLAWILDPVVGPISADVRLMKQIMSHMPQFDSAYGAVQEEYKRAADSTKRYKDSMELETWRTGAGTGALP